MSVKQNINVIMSSYNGDAFISKQLSSILNQKVNNYNLMVYVRDDGSTDQTKEILNEYSSQKVNVIFEENIGVVASFLNLLSHVDRPACYLAFSDQDDYWLPNKLDRAVSVLNEYQDIPALYCSCLNIVDRELSHIFYSEIPQKEITFSNALVENVATGCTIVINKAALQLVRDFMPDPKKIVMHDWWLYLVISAFGKIVFDHEPTILYRQHGNNVEGMKSGLAKLKAKFRNITRPPKYVKVSTQVAEFKRCYYQMLSNEQKKLVDDFLLATSGFNIWKKLKLILSGRVYRQTKTETLSLLISMLLKRI